VSVLLLIVVEERIIFFHVVDESLNLLADDIEIFVG
jgi:hypothetical protein